MNNLFKHSVILCILIVGTVGISSSVFAQAPKGGITVDVMGTFQDVNVVEWPNGDIQVVVVCICSDKVCYTSSSPDNQNQSYQVPCGANGLNNYIQTGDQITISINGEVIASGTLQASSNQLHTSDPLVRDNVIILN